MSACRRIGVAARVAGRDALPRDPPQAPPMVTSGAAPPTVDALRRVRRGTSTERSKVKIAEANRKGPQHRKRRTARRPEALYPLFPRSCAGVHDLWTCHAGSRGSASLPAARVATPTRPTADTPHAGTPARRHAGTPARRHASPAPAQRFWLISRMSIGFRFGYERRVICSLTQTHVRSDSTA